MNVTFCTEVGHLTISILSPGYNSLRPEIKKIGNSFKKYIKWKMRKQ